jgi:hypothetical protein
MSLSLLVASVLMGQSAFSLTLEVRPTDASDVAYEELTEGRNDEALNKLLRKTAVDSDDPAALINLGTAYAREGMTGQALASYRAAAASPQRYDLELADGTWMDSRWAARTAIRNLHRANALASR